MSGANGNPVADAAVRLEAAVDRLGKAAAAARRSLDRGSTGKLSGNATRGVSPEAVAALAARLETTLARLKEILGENEEV